jgi:hypothetical protein
MSVESMIEMNMMMVVMIMMVMIMMEIDEVRNIITIIIIITIVKSVSHKESYSITPIRSRATISSPIWNIFGVFCFSDELMPNSK